MNVLYYDVCKTNANLQRITIVNGGYSLGPDILLSAQMSSCDHKFTEWKRFIMTDANFTNTVIQINPFRYHLITSVNKFGHSFQIIFSNAIIHKCKRMSFMGIYEIIMKNVSLLESYNIVFTDVMLRIEGSFRFERNLNGMTVMSDLLEWNRGSRIIIANSTKVTFKDNILLSSSGSGTVMHVTASTFDILDNTYVVFEDNVGSQCGGILLENSTMNFHPGRSSLLFSHNKGNKGGAMAFYATSQIKFICSTTEIAFVDNHAERVGGAIYVHDFGSLHLVPNGVGYNYKPMLDSGFISNCQQSQVNLSFTNNTAQLEHVLFYFVRFSFASFSKILALFSALINT